MKLKRKGGLTAGIITLSAVALTSVGFAAWVISAGDTAEITGNIEVDTVDDDSHTIKKIYEYRESTLVDIKSSGKSEQSIKFGAPVTKALSQTRWLSNSETSAFENLTATYYVLVANGKQISGLSTNYVKAGFIVKDHSNAAAASLASYEGYVGAQSLGLVANSHTVEVTKLTSEDGVYSTLHTAAAGADAESTWFQVDIAFNWGTKFDWAGPSEYNASNTYKKGDLVKKTVETVVTYYTCNSDDVTGEWASGKWDAIDIYDMKNPYFYYNSMSSTTEITDSLLGKVSASVHANTYLTALNTLLNGDSLDPDDDVGYTFKFMSFATEAERDADTTLVTSGLTVVA